MLTVVGFLFCKVTEECLERGIAVCKDGASFKKIGKRIRLQPKLFLISI